MQWALLVAVSLLAQAGQGIATCTHDKCFKVAAAKDCSSFLAVTVTPKAM